MPKPSPKRNRNRNRGIPPRPALDIEALPASAELNSHEVAGLLRVTPGTIVDRWSGDDPDDLDRPLHPIKVGGRWRYSVGNVREVMRRGERVPAQALDAANVPAEPPEAETEDVAGSIAAPVKCSTNSRFWPSSPSAQ